MRTTAADFGKLLVCALASLAGICAFGQGNYEVQVYGSKMTQPGTMMLEFHSNLTIDGSKTTDDGTLPTHHAFHETIEITQGFTKWFETGYYNFFSFNPSGGAHWVGTHLRPRVGVPADWNWPVGVSLSAEFGYQRALFSPDTWNIELRPIVDKDVGKWYLCFNPTVTRVWHGPSVNQGVGFSPNAKASYRVMKRTQLGFEYYGSLGPITGFSPLRDQSQQFLPAIDIDFGPEWEFNFGIGVGATGSTDHLLMKMIFGRRFNWHRKKG